MASNNQLEAVYEHWKPLTDQQFELSMTDFKEFCRNSIVLDANGSPVTFVLNEAQELVAETVLKTLEPMMKKLPTPSIKILLHKSRQMGITTVLLKLEQYFMTKTKNLNALHIMPTEEECDELKDRKLIPLLQGTHPDLMAKMISSANYVDFESFCGVHLNNRLRYMPSGTRGSGHGRTIHLLVEDEYAKYNDVFTLEAGILPAMKGNTARIVLFTAKGMNHAYDLSKEAQREDNSWVYLFLPWYLMSEYELDPNDPMAHKRFHTDDPEFDQAKLTDYDFFIFSELKKAGVPANKWMRKAAWYDFVFREDAKRDWTYMFENYPTIAEESFRASGSPIFDAIKVNEWRSRPYKRLDIFTRADGENIFRYSEDGIIKELEPPIPGHNYIIGVDPADGEVKGDDSALVVWDVLPDKIKAVCCYNNVISQNDFAELVAIIGNRYNEAMIVPERNMGQLMIKWLVEVCQYTNIYSETGNVSSYSSLGVRTTVGTKNEMIARFKYLIANGYYEDFDPDFCSQANYFTYLKNNNGTFKAAASPGHHDDTVMCRCVATMALDMDSFGDYNEKIIREGKRF